MTTTNNNTPHPGGWRDVLVWVLACCAWIALCAWIAGGAR